MPDPSSDHPGRPGIRLAFLAVVTVAVCMTALAGVHVVRHALEDAVGRLAPPAQAGAVDETALRRTLDRIAREETRLRPPGPYLVVSSSDNRFALMNGADTMRVGLCSTGSYVRLTSGDGRSWLFTTPRGRRTVQEKRVRPVWAKPDWAFIEAGLPVPPAGAPERFEAGVLGRYALALGDGYLVHGTPYQRLLGQPVTHGCVRLGDDDLEAVFDALRVGSPVILY